MENMEIQRDSLHTPPEHPQLSGRFPKFENIWIFDDICVGLHCNEFAQDKCCGTHAQHWNVFEQQLLIQRCIIWSYQNWRSGSYGFGRILPGTQRS